MSNLFKIHMTDKITISMMLPSIPSFSIINISNYLQAQRKTFCKGEYKRALSMTFLKFQTKERKRKRKCKLMH